MKYLRKITNGVIIMIFGAMHTNFCLSPDFFGAQFREFSSTGFYDLFKGVEKVTRESRIINFEEFSAFWFFYWGIFLFPLGLLVHSIERNKNILPYSFSISYLAFIIIGAYMIPQSGMALFMLPHAVFMLIQGIVKRKKLNLQPAIN